MELFNKFTWCIIFIYCFYTTIKARNKEKHKNNTIKSIEVAIYVITIILMAALIDMLHFRYLEKIFGDILIPICIVLQVSMVVAIELLETKDENEKRILSKRLMSGVLRLIIVLIFFAWVMWE